MNNKDVGGASCFWSDPLRSLLIPRSPLLPQTQPDADVLAVQPEDAPRLPGDHRDAAGGAAALLPGGLLLLQQGEQASGERGLRLGPGEHGEHPAGPVLLLAEGAVLGGGVARGAPGGLRGPPHPLHTHERRQEQRTDTGPAALQPLLTPWIPHLATSQDLLCLQTPQTHYSAPRPPPAGAAAPPDGSLER